MMIKVLIAALFFVVGIWFGIVISYILRCPPESLSAALLMCGCAVAFEIIGLSLVQGLS